MADILEVRKVNKDKNWMDGILVYSLYIFATSVAPSRPCQTRKEEKITSECFSITRHQ